VKKKVKKKIKKQQKKKVDYCTNSHVWKQDGKLWTCKKCGAWVMDWE